MKFTAQKIDLVLELTTLNKEELQILPVIELSSEGVMNTMLQWKNIEKEEGNKNNAILVLSKQLAIIYPKNEEWFRKNCDVKTMKDIVIHVASEMGGLRKNEESSN